jgi:sugar lactone lactonase YvrE
MRALRFAAAAAFAGLVSGVSAASCGGGAGQLMVAVQTDLDIPKDIDKVKIEVSVRGVPKYGEEFENIGSASDALKLPATLALLPPDDPKAPVRVVVNGYKRGVLRVSREAVTTVPEDRLATLHIKLQVLCVDYVSGDAAIENECPDGLTCISGSCQSVEVDEDSLPDFGEGDVFGGGNGTGNGSCFDVVKCFKSALPLAQIDKEACTYAAAGDTSALNVAVLTESAGICGLTSCFVALDANSAAEGWTPVPGAPGTIALPKGVCNPAGPAVALSVVAAPVTAGCPQKTVKLPICGPFSSAGGKAEPLGQPGLGPIATSLAHPVSVVVDAKNNVFWANAGLWPADKGAQRIGSVKRASLGGGPVATISQGVRSPRGVALASDSVFFTNADPELAGEEQVMRLALADFKGSGLAPVPLVPTALPEGMASSGSTVLWTEFGTGKIRRLSYEGGVLIEGEDLASGQNRPLRIVADEAFACWTNEGKLGAQDGSVACKGVALPAVSPANVIWQSEATPRAIALTSDAVYWATFTSPGKIRRGVRNGSDPFFNEVAEDVVTTEGFPNGVAVDGTHIYWTTWGDGAVWRFPLAPAAGEEPQRLVTDQTRPSAITVTSDAIYWVNEGDPNTANGSVMTFAKPK